jgi:prohibitin 2
MSIKNIDETEIIVKSKKFFSFNWNKLKIPILVITLVTLMLVGLLFNRIFVNIYPGETGVMWYRFNGGTAMDRVYDEGLHIVSPFNKMYVYETRVQQRETIFTVLSKNGLLITIKAAVRFMPDRQHLPFLQTHVGPEYIERVVLPQIQSVIRKVVGNYLPDEIYGTQDSLIKNITQDAVGELRERYIILDELMIKELRLPETVASAIEQKLLQEQKFLEYEFRLKAEKEEVERKKLEAEGIFEFQSRVIENMTPAYLQYRGIQATLELAKSANAKVVIIGNSSGLPLILNMESDNKAGDKKQSLTPTTVTAGSSTMESSAMGTSAMGTSAMGTSAMGSVKSER